MRKGKDLSKANSFKLIFLIYIICRKRICNNKKYTKNGYTHLKEMCVRLRNFTSDVFRVSEVRMGHAEDSNQTWMRKGYTISYVVSVYMLHEINNDSTRQFST